MNLMRHLFIVLITGLFATQALALKSDRDQPADIEADDIEFDFKKGIRTYINNVLAIQGTLRLKADKLIAEYNGSELKKATVWGSLARFKQRPDGKDHDVEGWAKKIIVDQGKNTLTLIGKAALKQGPQIARGETIVYNMANDTLKVKGSAKMESSGKDGSRPKRQLKDPFADNADGPAPPKIRTVKSKKKNDDDGADGDQSGDSDSDVADATTDTDETDDAQEQRLEPVKRGRSRLIINPK